VQKRRGGDGPSPLWSKYSKLQATGDEPSPPRLLRPADYRETYGVGTACPHLLKSRSALFNWPAQRPFGRGMSQHWHYRSRLASKPRAAPWPVRWRPYQTCLMGNCFLPGASKCGSALEAYQPLKPWRSASGARGSAHSRLLATNRWRCSAFMTQNSKAVGTSRPRPACAGPRISAERAGWEQLVPTF